MKNTKTFAGNHKNSTQCKSSHSAHFSPDLLSKQKSQKNKKKQEKNETKLNIKMSYDNHSQNQTTNHAQLLVVFHRKGP